MWILILTILVSGGGGVTLQTTEMSSRSTCIAAGKAVQNDVGRNVSQAVVYYSCVQK